ncbi:TPA: hypothetical protein JGA48_004526 [Salmonella enterica]|nr:hypothetical protein [Salmonella enterica]
MGRSIPVKIGQNEFESKKNAVNYFMGKREAVKSMGLLKEGGLFDELSDLYLRYCEITGHPLGNLEIYAFSVDYEPRKNGQTWASHLCYKVQLSNGELRPFSVKKAIDAIVNVAVAEQR